MREDLAKMREELAPVLALTKSALRDLAAANGTYWKEAVGELHSQNNEIPIWVLLYEDVDILETHAMLCKTLRPHMAALAPLSIVLFYKIMIGDSVFTATLYGNEAVFSAGLDDKIDLKWVPSERGLGTIFTSRDSKRIT
jgi:hypothetical protein